MKLTWALEAILGKKDAMGHFLKNCIKKSLDISNTKLRIQKKNIIMHECYSSLKYVKL